MVNLKALLNNWHQLEQLLPGARKVAMVKADAYGHGLIPVSQFLESHGASCFGVATLEEGESLRRSGIRSTILLMPAAEYFDASRRILEARLTPMVSSIAELEAMEAFQTPIAVHVDVDTGMLRGGLPLSKIDEMIAWWKAKPRQLELQGLSTHFANAHQPTCEFSRIQQTRFEGALQQFCSAGLKPQVVHLAKSEAMVNGWVGIWDEIWVRPGIALYGGVDGFEPVMSLQARVTLVKEVEAGESVGYDQTWVAPHKTQIAILRAGYGDGYPRALSSRGFVLFQGKRVPVVGRVSMDLITVDVTGMSCNPGDWMTLMGKEGLEEITAQEIADACETISYEILTGIRSRVERVYNLSNEQN